MRNLNKPEAGDICLISGKKLSIVRVTCFEGSPLILWIKADITIPIWFGDIKWNGKHYEILK